jgi:hypothetical protein
MRLFVSKQIPRCHEFAWNLAFDHCGYGQMFRRTIIEMVYGERVAKEHSFRRLLDIYFESPKAEVGYVCFQCKPIH